MRLTVFLFVCFSLKTNTQVVTLNVLLICNSIPMTTHYTECQFLDFKCRRLQCVCVCVRACVRACMRACVRACVCVCVCLFQRKCQGTALNALCCCYCRHYTKCDLFCFTLHTFIFAITILDLLSDICLAVSLCCLSLLQWLCVFCFTVYVIIIFMVTPKACSCFPSRHTLVALQI